MPPSPRTTYLSPLRLVGALAAGAAVSSGNAVNELRACAGVARGRVRLKASVAGTLEVRFAGPDEGATVYTTPAAVSAAVVANTEQMIEFAPFGEAFLQIRFTPSANGTITYCDICGL